MSSTQIIAHRGDHEAGPENSLAAFKSAFALGISHLETDVHLSCDGHVMAFHDHALDRVSDVKGRINELTLAQIKAARLHHEIEAEQRIPTLRELFIALPDATFNIDAKSDEVVDALCDLVIELQCAHRVCLASFSSQRIARMRVRIPQAQTSMGQQEVTTTWLAAMLGTPDRSPAKRVQVPMSMWGVPIVTQRFIDYQHRKNRLVDVWTINDIQTARYLISIGVDGIMTDIPRKLLAAI